MQIGPFTIARTKRLPALSPISGTGGWWNVIRESFTGAWQHNVEIRTDTVLSYFAVFACTTLVASDIGKLTLRLVEKVDGVWTEIESAAFSPVLRKPNHYQTTQQFLETWILSLLMWGNTYVLKARDARGIVVKLFVLDASRVKPLVAMDGSVYYELQREDLANSPAVTIPASEIIHDRINCLFHPLVGLSPIYACGTSAVQGMAIQTNSKNIFANGSMPSGVLSAPQRIGDDTALRIKTWFESEFGGVNAGKVAVLGDGLKYEPLSYNAVDLQLIDQLKWTAETVCTCYHVPAYMVDIGPPPPYANIEPVIQKYFSQCLQARIVAIENGLDEGLGINVKIDGAQYGTEFDISDLIWMDMMARNKAAADGIGAGALAPNEARQQFFGLGPVEGGESPYLQQQNYSLAALAKRDAGDPFAPPPAPEPPPEDPPADPAPDEAAAQKQLAAVFGVGLRRKLLEDRRAA